MVTKKLDKWIISGAYIYLTLPYILFASGWLRPSLSIPLIIAIIVSLLLCVRDFGGFREITVSPGNILVSVLILACISAWVMSSGIGGYAYQNFDHDARNAVLRDLTNLSWPVIYNYEGEPPIHKLAGHHGALVYYIGYFLPAAAAGKLFGWKAANFAMYIWSVTGVSLSYYLFYRFIRRAPLFLLFIFISFSGIDALGTVLISGKVPFIGEHIEWWAGYGLFQYSSFTTTLFWVFNQGIPTWLITMLIINQPHAKNILFTSSLAVIFAPYSIIGMLLFVLYLLIFGFSGTFIKNSGLPSTPILHNLRGCMSYQNLVIAPALIILTGLYYLSNSSNIGSSSIMPVNLSQNSILTRYIIFCILEFGLYVILLWQECKKDPLFVISMFLLVIIPLDMYLRMNVIAMNFVMRASLPALIILMICSARYLLISAETGSSLRRYTLIILFVAGSITPLNEIYRSMEKTVHTPGRLTADTWKTFSILRKANLWYLDNFVAANPEKSLFFRYLSSSSASSWKSDTDTRN